MRFLMSSWILCISNKSNLQFVLATMFVVHIINILQFLRIELYLSHFLYVQLPKLMPIKYVALICEPDTDLFLLQIPLLILPKLNLKLLLLCLWLFHILQCHKRFNIMPIKMPLKYVQSSLELLGVRLSMCDV